MTTLTRMALVGAAAAGLVSTAACGTFGPKSRDDLVMAAPRCADTSFTVYFNEGSDRLTQPAMQLIRETSRQLRPCTVVTARVVGLADATGTPEANLSLSQRRAVKAAEALRNEGIPAPSFEIDAGGDAGATTAEGEDNPLRRRATVFLTVAPS